MHLIIAENYEAQAVIAADLIEAVVKEKPDCRLGFATGSSPLGVYAELARRCHDEGLDFSRVSTVNLDEYVGLPPEHEQSYRRFMDTNLFDLINIDKKNTYVPNGFIDPVKSVEDFRRVLAERATDLQLLGVGRNGHIGFNEPDDDALICQAHVQDITQSTIEANARFFASADEVPRRAITMGIGDIMSAKRLLTVINGEKAEAVRALLEDDIITTKCPLTLVKAHPDSTVIITRELMDKIG